MGLSRKDNPERRRLALMRKASTETTGRYNIGGVERKNANAREPSLPKMPWDDKAEPHQ